MENPIDHTSADWTFGNIKGFSSSQILDLSHGELKFLKVVPQASYPAHMHSNKVEYAVIIEGHPTITIDEQAFSAEVGDVFLFPSNVRHAISNKTDSDAVLLIGSIR